MSKFFRRGRLKKTKKAKKRKKRKKEKKERKRKDGALKSRKSKGKGRNILAPLTRRHPAGALKQKLKKIKKE